MIFYLWVIHEIFSITNRVVEYLRQKHFRVLLLQQQKKKKIWLKIELLRTFLKKNGTFNIIS